MCHTKNGMAWPGLAWYGLVYFLAYCPVYCPGYVQLEIRKIILNEAKWRASGDGYSAQLSLVLDNRYAHLFTASEEPEITETHFI